MTTSTPGQSPAPTPAPEPSSSTLPYRTIKGLLKKRQFQQFLVRLLMQTRARTIHDEVGARREIAQLNARLERERRRHPEVFVEVWGSGNPDDGFDEE